MIKLKNQVTTKNQTTAQNLLQIN